MEKDPETFEQLTTRRKQVLSIALDPPLRRRLQQVADAERRSVGSLIRELCETELDRRERGRVA